MPVSFQQNVSPLRKDCYSFVYYGILNTEPDTFNKCLLKELNEKHSTFLYIILYLNDCPSFSQDYNFLETRNYILITLIFPHNT